MKKVRANASWNELSAEQRETLDKWLFEERLSYTEAWPRAQKELGFKGSRTSLHRYFVRREKERILTEFKAVREEVAAVRSAPEDAGSLRAASMKVLGQFLFQHVRRSPDKVKEWAPVADLMVRNEYNEIVREAKAKEHEIRREAMKFAKEKFHYDMMEKALKALPQLQELAEAKKDPLTTRYEENAKWNKLRREIYGPGIEIHPESAEEEAAMLAAKKKEREARGDQEPDEEEETGEIIDAGPPPPSSPYYKEFVEEEEKHKKERERLYGKT